MAAISTFAAPVAGLGIFAVVVFILATFLRKKADDRMYGGFVRQAGLTDEELKALEAELKDEGVEIPETAEAEQAEAAEVMQGETGAAEAEKAVEAVEIGNLPAAEQELAKEEQGLLAKEKREQKILSVLKNLRKKFQQELKELGKERKQASQRLATAQAEAEPRQTAAAERKASAILQKMIRLNASIVFIDQLIKRKKAVSSAMKVTGKTVKQIEEQLREGVGANITVPKLRQIAGTLRTVSAESQQESGFMKKLLQNVEQDVAETRKRLAEDQAEKARLEREKQMERALISADKKIGWQLQKIEKTFAVIFKTEAKSKAVAAALKSDIIMRAKNLFNAAVSALKTYKRRDKNIALRAAAFLAISKILSAIIGFSKTERAELARALQAMPSKVNSKMLSRFDTAVALAQTILAELQKMESAMAALKAS